MKLIDIDLIEPSEIVIPLGDGRYEYVEAVYMDDLRELPSTEPQIVRCGEWIKMSDADGIYWACSECGEEIPRIPHFDREFDSFPHLKSLDKTNYCPNCGAKMKVV